VTISSEPLRIAVPNKGSLSEPASEMLREAGFANVRIRGEELLANVYGWTVRTLEGTAEPEDVPHRWRELAFRSYLALQRVDAALLEPRLPPSLFYNLVLSAIRT